MCRDFRNEITWIRSSFSVWATDTSMPTAGSSMARCSRHGAVGLSEQLVGRSRKQEPSHQRRRNSQQNDETKEKHA